MPGKTTHGMSKSLEYRTWWSMRRRCGCRSDGTWARYGGRGIAVCERWDKSFADFYKDMGPKPTPRHQLDRIDNMKGYSPGNCRWATSKEQAINRRSTKFFTYGGETLHLAEWARRLNLSPSTINWRVRRWGIERALTAPPTPNYGPGRFLDRAKKKDALAAAADAVVLAALLGDEEEGVALVPAALIRELGEAIYRWRSRRRRC